MRVCEREGCGTDTQLVNPAARICWCPRCGTLSEPGSVTTPDLQVRVDGRYDEGYREALKNLSSYLDRIAKAPRRKR